MDQYLPQSRTARLVIRIALAVVCFALAALLSVLPGPAFVFWIAGFVLLGFSAGQILLSVYAGQEFLRRRVPSAERLPRLRKHHIRRLLRNRWVRLIDRLSKRHEKRLQRRKAHRAEVAARAKHRAAS